MKKRTTRRNVINFFELSPEWQEEARRNLDEEAEEASYFEPLDGTNPTQHALMDLTECMRVNHARYDGVIGISNNSAMAVKLSRCGTQAVTWYLG